MLCDVCVCVFVGVSVCMNGCCVVKYLCVLELSCNVYVYVYVCESVCTSACVRACVRVCELEQCSDECVYVLELSCDTCV